MKDSSVMKGIAIILMLFYHLFYEAESYAGYTINYQPFTADQLGGYVYQARICVAMFIFISGYGLTMSCQKHLTENADSEAATFRFSYSRTIRLMSSYWFVLLLLLIAQPLGRTVIDAYGTSLTAGIFYFLIDVLGLSFCVTTPTMNPTWWYMSLALFFIWVIPVLYQLIRKFGIYTVSALTVMILMMLIPESEVTRLLVTFIAGIFCAEIRFFEKIDELTRSRRVIVFLAAAACCVLLLKLRYTSMLRGLTDAGIVLTLAVVIHLFLSRIPAVSSVPAFLGKHSMHMFLIHNMLYTYYLKDFFYSFRYWWLITIVLVAVSLVVGMIVEWIEVHSGYRKKVYELLVSRRIDM